MSQVNVNQAKGNIESPHQEFTIGTNDQLLSSKDYEPVIVAYRNGAAVRLKDVATIVDSAENLRQAAWVNTKPAVILNIQRQPGANIISVVDSITQVLPMLKSTLPKSVNVQVLTDRTTTIRASVRDVEFELMLTVFLVVMVIFLFLRTLAATVIPSIAVPLSIVGTFGVMYLLGYSLNNLSLMARPIATGFVIDDAIVVLEHVHRYGEGIAALAEAISRGDAEAAVEVLAAGAKGVTWIALEPAEANWEGELEPVTDSAVSAAKPVVDAARATGRDPKARDGASPRPSDQPPRDGQGERPDAEAKDGQQGQQGYAPPPPPPGYAPPPQGYYPPQMAAAPAQGGVSGIVALVFGILSILGIIFTLVDLPFIILGIVFGIIGRRGSRKGMATWGLALSVVALVLVIVIFVGAAVFISKNPNVLATPTP